MTQAVAFGPPAASAAGDVGHEGYSGANARADHVHDRSGETASSSGASAAPTLIGSTFSIGPGADVDKVTPPTGVQVGDVVLYVTRGTSTVTPPAGWTEVEDSTANGSNAYSVGWRALDATDVAASTWQFTGALDVAVIVYRGVVGDAEFSAVTKITTLTATTVTMPAVGGLTPFDTEVRLLGTASNVNPQITFTSGATSRVAHTESTFWCVGIADANPSVDTASAVNATMAGASDYVYFSVTLRGTSGTLTDPTTTKGDLLARNSSEITRVPVGTDGQVLTADSTASQGVAWAGGAWTSFSPTFSGTGWAIGNATLDCDYLKIGKLVHYSIKITTGSTTTYGSGALDVVLTGLPAPKDRRFFGGGTYQAGVLGASYVYLNSSSAYVRPHYVTSTDQLGQVTATTISSTIKGSAAATGDVLILSGWYEAA